MTITIIGNGSVQQNQYTVDEHFAPTGRLNYAVDYDGEGWQLTAVPDVGATFQEWTYTFHIVQENSYDGGQTWQTVDEEDYTGTVLTTATIQPDLQHRYTSDVNYKCFEGTRLETIPNSAARTRYTFSNQQITARFYGGHEPTHLILRDPTTGIILRGGTNNKILRDD